MTAAFDRCRALLRRGIMSGGDLTELFDAFATAVDCVGLWFSVERPGTGGTEVVREIDPAWVDAYIPYAEMDPTPRIAAALGPFGVFSAARHTPPSLWKTPLGDAFKRASWSDSAVMLLRGGCNAQIAAYRPRGRGPFSSKNLERMSALLPLFELALAPTSFQGALDAPSDETERAALARLQSYALLGPEEGQITFSAPALRLLGRIFGSFGARAQRRVERALRLAHRRFTERRGSRVVMLRSDLVVELAIVPQRGVGGSLVATFTERDLPPHHDAGSIHPHEELLSPTQRLVARRLVRGATIPELGRQLGISADAVKAHAREVYRRLGITSRAELAALYPGPQHS